MELSSVISSAIPGFVAGGVAGLLSPWSAWFVEVRREKLKAKRDRISGWRGVLGDATYFEDVKFSPTFAQLREFMAKDEIDSMFTTWMVIGGSGDDGERGKLMKLLGIVNRIEQEWDLV